MPHGTVMAPTVRYCYLFFETNLERAYYSKSHILVVAANTHLSLKLSLWFAKHRFKDRNPVSVSDLRCQLFQSLVTMHYTNNYRHLTVIPSAAHLLISSRMKASASIAVSVKSLSVASTLTGALNSNSQRTWILSAFIYQSAAQMPKPIVF